VEKLPETSAVFYFEERDTQKKAVKDFTAFFILTKRKTIHVCPEL
jgi:hypothetical protein